jgi:CheY-like chemotaxis protein
MAKKKPRIIWVAEDNDTVLEIMKTAIENNLSDVKVRGFTNPLEIVGTILKLGTPEGTEAPDMIITDNGFSKPLRPGENPFLRKDDADEMPNAGRAIIEQAQQKGLRIPIILLTGDDKAKLLSFPGMNVTILEKPADGLLEIVEGLLTPTKRRIQ